MDRLGLKDVRLVVWSSGCLVGWAYVRAYGTENLKAFVCIDHSPKPLKTRDDDWGRELADFQTFYETMTSERRALLAEMAEGMLQGTASDDAVKLVVDENMKAPTYVAVELFTDRMFSDYSAEARMLDGTLPTMFFLSEEGSEAAMAWIEENAPNAEVVRLGAHMMFWEYPDEFNAALDAFLDRVR
jgi:pimeloyl-ACP methyl ester carboxylesterase